MPQGKLRSGVYRSFIMCDDPRDVVESGAIKKLSKSHSSNNNLLKKKEKSEMGARKSTEEETLPSSLQLLRVSKGIQKLNIAIDSWSKGLSHENARPEDIAKDLLRGALDLEESLAMLSSIQEGDIKHKPRIERSISDRFGERVEKWMKKEENVASRDCYGELRKVIKESFIRQNLLPQTTTRSDFSSSSSSSSQSSMVSSSTKSSASSDRAPNLIARLMGLDVSLAENKVNHIDKQDILKVSEDQLKKRMKTKEIPETVSRKSTRTREDVLKSLPEEKPGSKRPVLAMKSRMQGTVHPRKDHQAKKESKTSKKDREPKEMVRKVKDNEDKVINLISPSNAKAVSRERKSMETNTSEGTDRYKPHIRALKPPHSPASRNKSDNSSDMSRNKGRRSRLISTSSSSSSDEQKSSSREKKSNEASRPNAKNKQSQYENDLTPEIKSDSSQDTHRSLIQLSAEETTSSEFNIQGHCDNGEVTSCSDTIQHSHDPETSKVSLKSFLSNSPEFLNYAKNLFNFKNNTKRSQESPFRDRDSIVISDKRLVLEFAKEVARRRSLLLIAEPTCPQRNSVHIDELLSEVCDGFESLERYRDTQNSFVKENVEKVLEKDLKGKKKEMTSGVWDLGWRNEFQIDETHQAVVDLEKLILSGLIQEIYHDS